MKRGRLFFVLGVLLAALIFLAGGFWWRWGLLPVSDQKDVPTQVFVIRKGEALASIASRLKQEGLVRDPFAFKLFVLFADLSTKIQAGDFRISPSLGVEEIVDLLTHGSIDIWLTFPEGWRREEYACRLKNNLEGFDFAEFVELTEELEGRLFPDTYLIPREATPGAVVKILKSNFEKKFTRGLEDKARSKDLTKKQVLILASILEREMRAEEDRPIVAGILVKRWRNDWPLQADAAVQYAVASQQYGNMVIKKCGDFDWWPRSLTKADLEIDSLFNTYKYKGLPPAPICSPGLASIEAVVDYKETPYWFYLSDSEGRTHYAKTLEEHNRNIARYLD